jgi:hypothetical protein
MSAPPTAGPSSIAKWRLMAFRRIALGKFGTDDVVNDQLDRRRGEHPRQAVDHEQHGRVPARIVPVRKRIAQASEASISTPLAIWMSRRQSKRSARAPAYTEKSKYGTQWLTTANPASVGEWKASKMTQ